MGRSWGHVVRQLTDAEIDHYDRWDERCAVSPKCQDQATHLTAYDYVTGRAGRVTDSRRRACTPHAEKFAAKHGIEIAPAPEFEPKRDRGIIAAEVDSFDEPLARVKLERSGRSWVLTEYGGNGFTISGTVWLDRVPAETALEDVLPHAEAELALRRRYVITRPWALSHRIADTFVERAERTPAWADVPWVFTIGEDSAGYGRAVWRAIGLLDEQFKPEVWALGTTGIDLDRAIRTTNTMLAEHWELGEWTRRDNTATTKGRARVR